MLQLKDRRSEEAPSVTVEDGDEILVRYLWQEDSKKNIQNATVVFSKRLKEMGETPQVIAAINRQVKTL